MLNANINLQKWRGGEARPSRAVRPAGRTIEKAVEPGRFGGRMFAPPCVGGGGAGQLLGILPEIPSAFASNRSYILDGNSVKVPAGTGTGQNLSLG
jgi:hypothetical protein